MENGRENKIGMNQVAIIAATVIGFGIGIFFSIKTKEILIFIVVGLFALVEAIFVRLAFELELKKLADRFAAEMDKVKDGDFSVMLTSKDYGILGPVAATVNTVLSDIRNLIDGFFQLALSIRSASYTVNTVSKNATEAVQLISQTSNEIAKGASSQAEEAQNGVLAVEKLADQINSVYNSSNEIIVETDKITQVNTAGVKAVQSLKEKSEKNFEATEKIFSVFEKFLRIVQQITSFTESIENITEQTNLLALNAAIEAARAGEAGLGFAVVADEVRKLADQSRQSNLEIANLVESIGEETKVAIEVLEDLRKTSEEQILSVEQTRQAFKDIADAIYAIVGKFRSVNESVNKMQDDKDEVIQAIEHISSVSQETAAASEEMSATTDSQMKAFDELLETSKNLERLVFDLDERLKRYKIR
ncbi:methyl-accepting chemotaxis sensory transducer [Thermoclostridium stercorarium subsp. stercorarium DSM 8532]|jgi:methyl-accepting chemotaxis protein|uniref:Methyl-accepting chemotaxis sensory transducer n=3 Tax=Thermoclostridium stercorarium TaxID=1510 RepID=L7VH20_THES1|nr:methyl-accepting chemotaxis protein [Thermoclostridium stercorarium]AGC67290.1 methyl-accepting chemotaxis sensory transducer [Thermoclostridium stercorarium subsp. stercorarium DSM 8532]AGI38355.1 chemotaxis protein [Thermoclostridium stercorarium subsp. stercorarium DSM 8532]ANW97792.1 chemotaxis protein [Thermoclostridium stercorarium subsp. thermolacticum DSM 2910]ANX00318.1 chemotaxis protein [Thermoclostridium stercorarium subsp. leptospartum DSM 9219]